MNLKKGSTGYWLWCPGCKSVHIIPSTPGRWQFNGDFDKPTFSPSIKHDWLWGDAREPRCCHYFITDGKIQFCGDSSHDLKGQTVSLPDLPDNWAALDE